ncbi:Sec-independent protein translocase protein TatA [Striga asiatica]|uniref:Sec-independent protein translocase protein TatA n=1 Tax=Striga asiatica TaxID=4170 RepID=A0A5A7QXL0_STRAF|nr:Sec-independent protein translocase protein TatA [Striga asiatica]
MTHSAQTPCQQENCLLSLPSTQFSSPITSLIRLDSGSRWPLPGELKEGACLFGLGVPELIVITGAAALVFELKKLPEVGRSVGKTVKSFQQFIRFRDTLVVRRVFHVSESFDLSTISSPPPEHRSSVLNFEHRRTTMLTPDKQLCGRKLPEFATWETSNHRANPCRCDFPG